MTVRRSLAGLVACAGFCTISGISSPGLAQLSIGVDGVADYETIDVSCFVPGERAGRAAGAWDLHR